MNHVETSMEDAGASMQVFFLNWKEQRQGFALKLCVFALCIFYGLLCRDQPANGCGTLAALVIVSALPLPGHTLKLTAHVAG